MAKRLPSGLGGKPSGGMNMIKQAQKMQQDMIKMQEEIDAREFISTAGGGAVSAVASGKRELIRIELMPEVVDPDDVEMLQDLIVAAANEALRQAEEAASEEMKRLTGGISMPGLF